METVHNSAFKIKVGPTSTLIGIAPEKGAMVFDLSQNAIFVGDGFNWLPLNPQIASESTALTGDDLDNVLTLATPALFTFFDTIFYETGTLLPATVIGQLITVGGDMEATFNFKFKLKSTVAGCTLEILTLADAAVIDTRNIYLDEANIWYEFEFTAKVSLSDTEVITQTIESDKSATITVGNSEYGLHKSV